MNLLADEGIDKPIVDRLRQDGHQVLYIAEESSGLDDEAILALANRDRALLLTRDKDFGELCTACAEQCTALFLCVLMAYHPKPKQWLFRLL
jgi:predicted nuclease of predicted toxin-antitoxin system